MDCPVCKSAMEHGYIPANRSALKWHGSSTVRLTGTPWLNEESAEAFYCPQCRHIMMPVPEIETFSDKICKKMDAVSENLKRSMDEADARKQERRKEKSREKRKGKDPWEL